MFVFSNFTNSSLNVCSEIRNMFTYIIDKKRKEKELAKHVTRKGESRLACSYLKVRPSHFSFIFLAITKYHRSFFPTRTTPSRNLKFRAHDETLSIAIKVSWNPSYHTQSRSAGHTIYIYISGELEIKGKSLTKTRRAGALSSFLTFLPFFSDS